MCCAAAYGAPGEQWYFASCCPRRVAAGLVLPCRVPRPAARSFSTLAGPIVRFPLLLVSLLHTQTRATRARYTRESQTRVDDSHVLSRDHAPLIIPCQLRRARSLVTVRTRLTRVPIHSRTRPLMKVSSKRGGLGRLLRLEEERGPTGRGRSSTTPFAAYSPSPRAAHVRRPLCLFASLPLDSSLSHARGRAKWPASEAAGIAWRQHRGVAVHSIREDQRI